MVALLVAGVVGIILQITMGGVVRVTGSGLGCPDWPTCHGRLIPPPDYHAWIEWTHRTVGALVGVVLIGATARVWLRHRSDRAVLWFTTATLALIAVVGGIGGSVVLTELHPALRTLHLLLAEADLAIAVAALAFATRAFQAPSLMQSARAGDPPVIRMAWIGAVAILVALLTGSYAVWQGAGTICASWPLCGGPVLPTNSMAWTHMAHRLLAGAGSVVLLVAAHRAYRLPGASGAIRLASLAVLALVLVQILVGAANPWTGFQQWVRALHLTLATLVWAGAALVAVLVSLRSVGRDEMKSDAHR
ncbi:MAG: heme A synthase [Chloroflexi bacterium]|nr:heme A synthase [Chloroflexota bacterium]